jgi:hypothetical protein
MYVSNFLHQTTKPSGLPFTRLVKAGDSDFRAYSLYLYTPDCGLWILSSNYLPELLLALINIKLKLIHI